VAARGPGLLALFGVGPHSAAILLIAAGDHRPRGLPPPPPHRRLTRPSLGNGLTP
jgi:hypothetical protein